MKLVNFYNSVYTPIGGTVVVFNGEPKNIEDAIHYLKEKNVRVDRISLG